MPVWRFLPVVTLLLAACEQSADIPRKADAGGTVVIATMSDPDILFPPFTLTMEGRQATELIYEYLADVGPAMNTIGDSGFVKQITSGWIWSADSMSIAFAIDPRAQWQDTTRLTSHDVVFSFRLYTDSAVGSTTASSLADIDSVSAPDSATAVFWFKRRTPHQFFDAAAQMLILPAHILASIPRDSLRARVAEMKPMGSGRFHLRSIQKGTGFELQAVEQHYRGRPNPDRVIWTVSPEYVAAMTRLLGGEADVLANIRQESIRQLAEGGRVNLLSLEGMDYVFMQLNLANPLFASRELRRALTASLDRHAMVRNLFDTLALVSIGPTVRAYPTTDTALAQIRYDTVRASRTLDSLGWKRKGADGWRERNGRRLRFTTIVPVTSASRMRIAVLLQEQLRRAGIEMRIEQMDFSAFSKRQSDRSFDAALASWHLGSNPSAAKETWTVKAAGKGGLNYGGYRNPAFDSLIDSALTASTVAASRDLFRRAHQIIVDDAPAVWLYEPRTLLAVNRRITTTPMRPNAWWLDIASWKVTGR